MNNLNTVDKQYNELIKEVIKTGYSNSDENVRAVYADGVPAYTHSLIGKKFVFSNGEVPILTTKFVGWKTAIKELLWIWQQKSNSVEELREVGVNIWNEWELHDGTIGKAYGYQLKQKAMNSDSIERDQVDYIIHEIKNNPSSRRIITTLWKYEDLNEMALTPCVYETQWHVKGNKLHLEVRTRSNDLALGNPFNIFQYSVLHRMIAQVTGYEIGEYIFHMGDAHIYDRHIPKLIEQINNPTFKLPTIKINSEVKDFYDFTIDDFELIGYNNGGKYEYEVAI